VTPLGSLALFLVGAGASVFGSLVGLGGGFVVIPVLRLAFGVPPAEVAGTSLVLVFANTASSSIGFWRDGKINPKLALPFVVGAVPTSILGILAVKRFSSTGFDVAYGIMLLVLAGLVLRRRYDTPRPPVEHRWVYDPRVGVAGGLLIGFFSSAFGIGAGFVMVPLLLLAARMPPHIVAATSAFVITATAPVAIVGHAVAGDIDWAIMLPLVLGGLVGGSIAPAVSRRVSSPLLVTLLAAGLIAAAIGLVLRHVAFGSPG
jgi:uncharacterized membrane protein YfcA